MNVDPALVSQGAGGVNPDIGNLDFLETDGILYPENEQSYKKEDLVAIILLKNTEELKEGKVKKAVYMKPKLAKVTREQIKEEKEFKDLLKKLGRKEPSSTDLKRLQKKMKQIYNIED